MGFIIKIDSHSKRRGVNKGFIPDPLFIPLLNSKKNTKLKVRNFKKDEKIIE